MEGPGPRPLLLVLALAFSSCSREGEGEQDLDWRVLYERDPQATLDAIRALDDPLRQEAVLLELAEADPARAGQLCPALPEGPARERCERIANRPHLQNDVSDRQGRLGITHRRFGASEGGFTIPEDYLHRWDGLEPEAGDCAASPEFHLCIQEAAQAAVRRGDVRAAARLCLAIEEQRWRQDCFFVASEAVFPDERLYSRGMALCQGAGSFSSQCHGHLLLRMRELAGRDGGGPEKAIEQARRIERWWAKRDPAVGALAVDRFWAGYTLDIVHLSPDAQAPAFEALPPEAHPHLRDALALAHRDAPDPYRAVHEAARRRPDGDFPWGPLETARPSGLRDVLYWPQDLPGEERIPAVYYLEFRPMRRPVSDDPEVDERISVLIASAVSQPPRLDLLHGALDSEVPLLRWLAVALLGELEPESPLLGRMREDPDELVRRRAEFVVSVRRRQHEKEQEAQ